MNSSFMEAMQEVGYLHLLRQDHIVLCSLLLTLDYCYKVNPRNIDKHPKKNHDKHLLE